MDSHQSSLCSFYIHPVTMRTRSKKINITDDQVDSISSSVLHSTRRIISRRRSTTNQNHAISISSHVEKHRRWSKRAIILGIIIGVIVGKYIIAPHHKVIGEYLNELELFSRLFAYVPSPAYLEILRNFTKIWPGFDALYWESGLLSDTIRPGEIAANLSWKAHYPIVIIPGLISSGLELWHGKACAKDYFRQRLWGSLTMLRFLLLDKDCWLDHITMDKCTGLDPDGVKLRPAQGLEAADYLIPGYWVWGRIIESLGDIGYDNDNLHMASYDWRIRPEHLEQRDHYFSRLKVHFETSLKLHKRKAVIICHSMGALITLYFMKWVESAKGGNGGDGWIDKHINTVVSIAGNFLGNAKPIPSIIAGEAHDTIQLGPLESYLLDQFMSTKERIRLSRHWPGFFNNLPKGGNVIWGSDTNPGVDGESGIMFEGYSEISWTIDDMIDTMYNTQILPDYTRSICMNHPDTFKHNNGSLPHNDNPDYWINPLQVRLPYSYSSQLKFHCMYGVGNPTERGYHFSPTTSDSESVFFKLNSIDVKPFESRIYNDLNNPFYDYPHFRIDIQVNNQSSNITRGIRYSDGDGTIPLVSLGWMCMHGWRNNPILNPSDIPIVTKEYKHEPINGVFSGLRGGPKTSEHVDILGNFEMTLDILRIVSNRSTILSDNDVIYSEIKSFRSLK